MSLQPLKQGISQLLQPYLPQFNDEGAIRPFVTLTYAQSIDARISRGRGLRTIISHPETKTMTHYLRYHHDGILIGSGTVLADNPGLNCQYGGLDYFEHSPRPIILDGSQKWRFIGSKMHELFSKCQGKAPIVVVPEEPIFKEDGVTYLICPYDQSSHFNWKVLFSKLYNDHQLKSVMIEGGANVINQLLVMPDLVDTLIITIGSTFLGSAGVEVSPPRSVQLNDIQWWRGSKDAVMAAKLSRE